jgi:hypothetical protein
MTNERKVELLKILRLEIHQTWIALHNCGANNEELQFVHFEKNRILAELNYSINYYEEHKNDTK